MKIKTTTMQKCLREQKAKGKDKLESKQICRKKLGYKLKK